MDFKEYIEEKCKNCNKECTCKIVAKSNGQIECVEDNEE